MDLLADALPSKCNMLSNCASGLDLNILRLIERELVDNDKISILFLMLDDYKCFDAVLNVWQSKERANIISEFVTGIQEWPEKFLEALCICNNERVVMNLGQKMEELEMKYFPRSPSLPYKVNVGAKILYSLFDQFNDQEAELFLNSIYKVIQRETKLKNINLLEIHALYWIHMGLIVIKSDCGDFSQLLKHLKGLGHHDLPLYCDMEQYSKDNVPKTTCVDVKMTENREENHELPKIIDKSVKGHFIKKGLCVIINEVNFPLTMYETRHSSRVDAQELKKTFRGLGFDVELYTDRCEDEIFKIIDHHASINTKNYDCLSICLLSHGFSGGFISTDGHEIPIDSIEEQMCSSAFRNAVKLLIVQACQGKNTALAIEQANLAIDGPRIDPLRRPITVMENYRSFFLFISTMKNFISLRHRENGSWFIQALCRVLQTRRTEGKNISIDQWSKEVKREVQSKRGRLGDGEFVAQLPESRDRLIQDIFFPLYEETNI